jgi:hypothetical protein
MAREADAKLRKAATAAAEAAAEAAERVRALEATADKGAVESLRMECAAALGRVEVAEAAAAERAAEAVRVTATLEEVRAAREAAERQLAVRTLTLTSCFFYCDESLGWIGSSVLPPLTPAHCRGARVGLSQL